MSFLESSQKDHELFRILAKKLDTRFMLRYNINLIAWNR
jgi:hypothetical protein